MRRSEKKALMSQRPEMYKLVGPLSKARVQEQCEKSFVLLQAYIDEVELEGSDYTLRQEIYSMVDYAARMLAAIEEYGVKDSKHGNVVAHS